MGNQITGKDAYVVGIPCIQNWGFGRVAAGTRYQASCTNGGTNTTAGNVNVTGTISGVGLSFPQPSSADLAFRGIAENTTGDLRSYAGNIRISQTVLNFNVAGAAPITWTSTFGVQGDLTESVVLGGADTTISDAPSAKDATVVLGSTTLESLQSGSVTFVRPEATYVDSGFMHRNNGNLQVDATITVADKRVYAAHFLANALQKFQLLISSTVVVELEKVRMAGPSGIVYDRAANGIVQFSNAMQWNAVDGTTPGWVVVNGVDIIGDSTP